MAENKNSIKSSLFSILKFTIGWPISLIALFFIVKIIIDNGKSVLSNLNNINVPLLFFGIFFFILYYFIRAYVWKIILKLQGYDLPFKHVAYLWELSEFKRFAPGKIWSFMGRISLFGNLNIPQKTIFKSIFIEIQFLLLANIIVSILAFPFILTNIIKFPSYDLALGVSVLLILLSTIVFIFSDYRPFRLLPLYSPKTKISILSTSCLYAIFFGFGMYFSTISIVYLPLERFIAILGFFVFSYLISYLSIISPMGIGVREGIITFGLSKIIPIATAGIVSIFARLALVFSELCFLCFTYLWKTTKNKYVLFLENFVLARKQQVVLALLIIAYIIYFTSTSFLRYDNFYTGRFDLGNMDQTVWNTIHGRIFKTNSDIGAIISRLAVHADFILIFLSPLYLIWEHAKMLLLLQTVILGVGAFFVFAIAKHVLKNANLSLTLAIAYLFNPSVNFVNLYDFHAVSMSTTFLLAAFYFVQKNRYPITLVFLILAGITKEQVWLIVTLLGLYALVKDTPCIRSILVKRAFGITVFIGSVFIFYYLIWHAIPNVRGGEHFALSFYSGFGDRPTSVIKNILTSPDKILNIILEKERLIYLKNVFLPVGFLPIFAFPFLFFASFDFAINLLSSNSNFYQIYYQYTSTITPFIFISSIFGINYIKSRFPNIPTIVYASYLILATIYSSYSFGPLPFAKNPNIAMFTKPQKDAKAIENFLNTIPKSYTVSATNNIGSHVSQRQKIATIPVRFNEADYVLFLLNDASSKANFTQLVESLRTNENYMITYKIGDFIAFKKTNLNP